MHTIGKVEKGGSQFLSLTEKITGGVKSLMGLFKSKEHKPVTEMVPYIIDANLSMEDKLKNGWRKENVILEAKVGLHKLVDVLIKDIATQKGRGRVLEYISHPYIKAPIVGQQLYDKGAIQALGLMDDLPTKDDLNAMVDAAGGHDQFIQQYFTQDGQIIMPGYFDNTEHMFNAGKTASIWVGLPMANSGIVENINGIEIAPTYMTYQSVNSREFLSLLVRKQ